MRSLIYITIVSFFISCSQEEIKIPQEVIKPEKMSKVLLDLQLMKSHLDQERVIDPFVLDSINAYYNSIYTKHDVSKAKFDSSLHFYSINTVLLDSIYNRVFAELKTLELELKDIKYDLPNLKYLTREELISNLKKLNIRYFIAKKDVNFITAKDSLDLFIGSNKKELEKLKITPSQLKNSFAVYAKSKKRFEKIKFELK